MSLDAGGIAHTRDYLLRFEAETAKVKTAAELIEAIKRVYLQTGRAIARGIDATVAEGEMK
jgi:hypothetical protein